MNVKHLSQTLLGAFACAAVAIISFQFASAQLNRAPEVIFQSRFEASENIGVVPFTPPDPPTTWIPLDPTIIPSFHETIKFLYEAPNPVQRGMRGDPIQPYRATVARGRVLNDAGQPLSGVLVRFLDFPDWGYTYTRTDGYYDLVGNGGADITLDFSKAGFIRSQRRQFGAWKSYSAYDDIRLIPYSTQSQLIQLGSAQAQIGNGLVSTDADGSRRASVYFPAGVTAQAISSNGSATNLPQLTFRATEFTVGANGAQRMPGTLPQNIAYTYAVELSADEAVAAGAEQVKFSQPVSLYLDNFLGVKIGERVPLAYYDYRQGRWIGEPNGHVAKVLSINAGLARIDVLGNGVEATAAEYLAFGITPEEQLVIGQRFAAGQGLWRAKISHFTPWDCNWPVYPPDDAEPPPPPEGDDEPTDDDGCPEGTGCEPEEEEPDEPDNDKDKEECGSILSCQDRTLREVLSIAGSTESLLYSSDRTAGHGQIVSGIRTRKLRVRLTPAAIPNGVTRIYVRFSSFGQTVNRDYSPVPNLFDTFDLRFNSVYSDSQFPGFADYTATVCYVYPAVYARTAQDFPNGWARFGAATLQATTGIRTAGLGVPICTQMSSRAPFPTVIRTNPSSFFALDQRGQALGGLGVTSRHLFDPETGMLYMGNGKRGPAEPLEGGYNRLGSVGAGVLEPLSIPNNASAIGGLDAAGCVLYWELIGSTELRLNRYCPGRNVESLGSIPTCQEDPYAPGSCPIGSVVNPPTNSITLPNGTIYMYSSAGIFRVSPGPIRPIYRLDTDPQARCLVSDVAPYEGTLAVSCNIPSNSAGSPYVAVIGQNDQLERVAGGGDQDISVDPLTLRLDTIQQLIVSPANEIYLITSRDGDSPRALRFAAFLRPEYLQPKDASGANLNPPRILAPGIGGYYWLDTNAHGEYRIHSVNNYQDRGQLLLDPTSPLVESEFIPQLASANQLAMRTAWLDVSGMKIGPDGSLFITRGNQLYRYGRSRTYYGTEPTGYRIPSSDGSEVYVFDRQGRHLETRSKLTGAITQRFVMNAANQLIQVADGDGNALNIDRLPGMVRFTAPDGQVSELLVNADGYATSMKHVAARWIVVQLYQAQRKLHQFCLGARRATGIRIGLSGWAMEFSRAETRVSI
jgi:hypothetical protein